MNCSSISTDKLKQLWKYSYAWASFSNTIAYAKRLVHIYNTAEDDLDIKALTYSIVISYVRPFKQKGNLKLGTDSVVPKYIECHKFLIEMRDKVISHQDPVTTETPFGYLNQVRLHFQDAGNWHITTLHPIITSEKSTEIICLAKSLLAMCNSKTDDVLRELNLLHLLESGQYTILPGSKTNSGQYELRRIST